LPRAKVLNLMRKGHHENVRSPKALTILLLLSILALWVLYLVAPLKMERKRLAEIDQQIAARKEEVLKVEALKKETEGARQELASIHDFKSQRPLALNILKELTSILPKNAWLSRMRITRTGVDIEGYAGTATGLLSKLEASPYFRKVEFGSPTFRDTRLNAERFNIKMELEGVQTEQAKAGEENEDTEE
jgi:general secretion pathway protein L